MIRTVSLFIVKSFFYCTQCAEWEKPDYGQRNCPKHLESHSRNKIEKLVYLVGFSLRKLHSRVIQ
jgi:hypothetical protein